MFCRRMPFSLRGQQLGTAGCARPFDISDVVENRVRIGGAIIPVMRDPVVREFLLAFWKIHILHHAAEQGIYGQWMLEELHHHGYRLSPGTLYPMLARMEKHGWLRATEPKRSKAARVYRLTASGHQVLQQILDSLDELSREVGGRRPRPRHSKMSKPKRSSASRPRLRVASR
jgi:PadR family transcriptional regulator PadR